MGKYHEANKRRRFISKTKKFGHHWYWLWDKAVNKKEAENKAWQARRQGLYVRIYETRHHPEAKYLIYVSERKRKCD